MNNEMFKKAIDEALTQKLIDSIPSVKVPHVFSREFEKKMSKLIMLRRKPFYMIINTAGKRAACLIIGILVIAMTTVMSVEAFRTAFFNFFIEFFDDYVNVHSIETETAPENIEDIYNMTYGLSDYKIVMQESNNIRRHIIYNNKDCSIDYVQSVKKFGYSINSEKTFISYVDINECQAFYYTDNHNYNYIMWDNGDYLITLGSNISKDELIKIAESVQKVE